MPEAAGNCAHVITEDFGDFASHFVVRGAEVAVALRTARTAPMMRASIDSDIFTAIVAEGRQLFLAPAITCDESKK